VHTETLKKMFQARLYFWMTVNLSFMTVLYQATTASVAGDCDLDTCDVEDRLRALELRFEDKIEVCPSGFVYLSKAPGCYKVMAAKLPWEDSRKRCSALSPTAHLAIIDNNEENAAIVEYLKSLDYVGSDVKNCLSVKQAPFYTSGQRIIPTDCHSDLVWKVEGRENTAMSYNKWDPGQPDCFLNNEACLAYDTPDYSTTAHVWNDVDCKLSWCSLCEDSLLPSR